MKLIRKAAVALLPLAFVANASALESDKVKHLGVSFALGVAGEQLASRYTDANPVLVGAALGFVPGLLKEIADERRKGPARPEGFSGKDLAADAVGAVAGALVSNLVSERFAVAFGRDHRGGKKIALMYTLPLD